MKIFSNGQQYIQYLREKQMDRVMPFDLTFELTPLCNFSCKMCYIRLDKDQIQAGGGMLSSEEWLKIAREAQNAGVYKICFTGGEIFTYPDFQRIYETVYDMGFHITLISNGYLIDEKSILWLNKRKPDYIKITIYGASNETYQQVCGVDQGFTRVTSNIRKLKQNNISVVTCMTVIEQNRNDIDKVKEWTKAEGLPFVYSKVIRKTVGNARSKPEDVRVPFVYNNDIDSLTVMHTTDYYQIKDNKPFENCRCYHNSCIIGWNGLMKGCNFINTVTVNIKNRELVDCFKELWAKLDRIRRPEKCVHCRYLRFCNPCPGALEGESGDPEMTSEYVCDLAKWSYSHLNLNPAILAGSEMCEQ